MSFQIYMPQAPLQDYVQMIWQYDGYHPPHPRERILPSGMMEITISLSHVPFRLYDPLLSDTPQTIYGAMVVGARSDFFVVETSAPMTLLSVWFKPGGAQMFLGASGKALHNAHVPLDALWGDAADELVEQLLAASTVAERIRILEAVLLERLYAAQLRHRAVDYALKAFRTVPHMQTISDVVDEIALSPTRFIHVFREEVGMTPKQFCRVRRFQYASRMIANDPASDWVDVALACGYYDQSHFINDFRNFAGITPTEYAPQDPDHNMNLAMLDEG